MMSDLLPGSALSNIAWGAGGALGTAALSKLLLPQATGAGGFLRDAASVLGIGWVARQVGGREAQTAAIIGGGTILAVKLLNTLGVGRNLGLSEMAAGDYSELGAYYEDTSMNPYPGLGAYYEDSSLTPYYGVGAYGDDTMYEDEDIMDDYDELGDDEDEMMGDYDELGDEYASEGPGLF